MKKLLVALLAFGLVGMLLMPLASAFAQPSPANNCAVSNEVSNTYGNSCNGCNGTYNPETNYSNTNPCSPACCILTIVDNIGTWFFWIVMIVAFIMMLWGAMQFMTAGGNEDQTGQARRTLIYALIGVAIAWFSQFLIDMVQSMLAG